MSEGAEKLLFVEDDNGLRRQLSWGFSEYEVHTAENRDAAMKLLKKHRPKVAVIDLGLPPDTQGATEGLALLESIRVAEPATKVIVMTGNEDRNNAVQSISLGAYDFCSKPVEADALRLILQRAFHLWQLENELRNAHRNVDTGPLKNLITGCESMQNICRLVERIAPADVTVMLLGESGTGKEVMARALHELSPRAGKPFVAINCAAIPENLLESELFGHEKGSFTGASQLRLGKVEVANGGTLFLDEIGDIPLPLQVKLLRFLQERVIERIGGRTSIAIDVRVVCATHRNMQDLMREQKFREDLYYRLNEFTINIPALRERPGDAVLLAHFFLNQFAAAYDKSARSFTSEALAAIAAHPWPGNVRELQNRVKRALFLADGDLIGADNLELSKSPGRGVAGGFSLFDSEGRLLSLKEIRDAADQRALEIALGQATGNISQAAKLLGISRPTLYDLIKVHNIKV